MPDKSALWVWQHIYEPTQTNDGKWTVFYKQNNKWEEKKFDVHEEAYTFYYKKMKELTNYYNTFLRELGVKQR